MDILNEFGVKWELLIAQLINFVIVFLVLKKLFYKKILDALKERQKQIKEGLMQAEESRVLLEKTKAQEKEVLKHAQNESKKILEETRKQSAEIIQKAEESAKIQAQKIINDARSQIETESKQAQKALALQLNTMAVELLKKSASLVFAKADQEKIIKNALENLKKRAD